MAESDGLTSCASRFSTAAIIDPGENHVGTLSRVNGAMNTTGAFAQTSS